MAEPIQAADMVQAMANLGRQLADAPLDEPLERVAARLQEGFADNFQRTADSEGNPWPERKDKRPNAPTHPLLQLTTALLKSVQSDTPDVAGRTLHVGVDGSAGIPYARVHQFGYPPRNIAQREYLYASEDVLAECAELIADGVVDTISM